MTANMIIRYIVPDGGDILDPISELVKPLGLEARHASASYATEIFDADGMVAVCTPSPMSNSEMGVAAGKGWHEPCDEEPTSVVEVEILRPGPVGVGAAIERAVASVFGFGLRVTPQSVRWFGTPPAGLGTPRFESVVDPIELARCVVREAALETLALIRASGELERATVEGRLETIQANAWHWYGVAALEESMALDQRFEGIADKPALYEAAEQAFTEAWNQRLAEGSG